MLPGAHIATGVLLFIALQMAGVSPLFAVLAVIGAVLPDADAALYRINGHRRRITHAPLFWLASLATIVLAFPQFVYLAAGVFIHLILDTADWGIMWLYPFRKGFYGGTLRKKGVRSNFLHHYLSHNGFVALELVFLISALLSSYFVLL